ncbi:MarR family winged helix-turn-helix transcriptional regulator [Streptomyces thermodiastaticus]|uniref:MarR family transcriptional regulator n=1 Tax=Streptomyces thermoviolaceus subsp. thermoviolaceus TaxID=66860 RepID=A0ABX0YXY2_STRTL|nr:MarR family transcriptional regulator [Streptomyces thermoviolaceus]NJP17517.1 MarR family transcriptional regulator [Streptomyces thermoviolaceus subsp. thermoviolaceus]GHB11188.1 MarR family transcriptional regulator [Streptomyces thermoviolaceus subsp. thermoviolaceus]
MAGQAQYEELVRQLSAVGAVRRDLARIMPPDCPAGSGAVLTILDVHGDMHMSKLAEHLAVDLSVTSRQVAHLVARGWIERLPDPVDKRSRILHLTPAGLDRLDDLFRRTTQLLAERLSDWSDDEVGQLIHLMSRLRESFGDCRPHPGRVHAPADTPVIEETTRTPANAHT